MITQEDIDAFANMMDVKPQDYSYWVEGKIVTEGETRLVENTLGLVGEAGEVAEKTKKMIRDGSNIKKGEIVKELGDVLFYTTAIANYFDTNLQEIININVDKLEDRASRGVLQGSGDNR